MLTKLHKLQLPYAVLAIIIGTLLSRFGTAMILPYVTILLVQQKHLALYWSGLSIGLSYLAQAMGASLTGRFLADLEAFMLIKIATLVYAFTFIALGLLSIYGQNISLIGFGFILSFCIMGLCRSLIETTGQAIISEITPNTQKYFAFSLRYTCINIGTSLGPIIAIFLGILNTNFVFFVAAFFVASYAAILQLTVQLKDMPKHKAEHKTFFGLCRLLYQEKKLLYFILGSIFCFIGFSQMETLFAFITFHYTGSTHIFAIMYMINGAGIAVLQIPLVRLVKKFDLDNVIIAGALLLTIGLIGVITASTHPNFYYCSMFIFTLGEIFSLSLMGIYIDHLATPTTRHLYFGISNFSLLGRVCGPPLATALCTHFGLNTGLYLIAGITALSLPCIWLAKHSANSISRAELS